MGKLLVGALVSSLVVVLFGLSWHGLRVSPNDWQAVVMWLPLYVAPIWGFAGASYLSERGKK